MGEQEPTRTFNGVAITPSFGHDLNTPLEQLKSLNRVDMRAPERRKHQYRGDDPVA